MLWMPLMFVIYIYICADGDIALREDRWCLLLFLCLRAKRITCAFSVCSMFFVPHGNEKHVVPNTLIFVYMNRLWPSEWMKNVAVFRIRLYAIFSPNETKGNTVMYCSNSRKPIKIAYVFTRKKYRKPKLCSVWVCLCAFRRICWRYVLFLSRLVVVNWAHVVRDNNIYS